MAPNSCWLPGRFSLRLLLLLAAAAGTTASGADTTISFNRDIRPILSDKCFFCHGPDPSHREADLRLDVESDAKEYAIVAGAPQVSDLFLRVTSEDVDERMPPAKSGKSLTSQDIDLLKEWIKQGAKYEPFWAYVSPGRHAVPDVQDNTWPANWIDRFILARLESEGLSPSPDADRVTLIRRVCFDLTGLPPTPKQVDDFLADSSPRAYQRVVDRLLASQRYGERMAMYWLDLVRYADTVGYHGDQDHNISPYRDYVIDSFNDNIPFDRFTREQLAGDLLPNSGVDQKIASGYNRLLQTSHEGGVQPKEYLAIYAADRVRNLSNVWMGATMGCCQCHDHKYDPFSTKDFYSMVAFFADIDEAQHFTRGNNSLPTARPPEMKVLSKRERQHLAELEQRIAELRAAGIAPQSPGNIPGKISGKISGRSDAEVERQIGRLQQQRKQLEAGRRLTMVTVAIEPRPIRILPRGNWLDDSGPIVEPAVPDFLGGLDLGGRRATRADLADWLTDVRDGTGGLTSRVFVNRCWYLLFGIGIAKTLDDFGGQGEPPVHPELLDNLAVQFYESGWDVKRMMKLLVMSRVYRQSSLVPTVIEKRDPYNRLYARQSRFRLPAEMVRDNALAVSGLLVEQYGGASVKPYQPVGYYRHLNFPQRKYQHHSDRRQWRRGVYVHWQRQFLHPMLKALDAPGREECTAERLRSNTPLAALTLLNDPTFVEAARVFAARILSEGGTSDAQRLRFAFRLAVSRLPDKLEQRLLTQLVVENERHYRDDPDAARQIIGAGLAAVPDDVEPVQLAAWTAAARAILNLSESITRN